MAADSASETGTASKSGLESSQSQLQHSDELQKLTKVANASPETTSLNKDTGVECGPVSSSQDPLSTTSAKLVVPVSNGRTIKDNIPSRPSPSAASQHPQPLSLPSPALSSSLGRTSSSTTTTSSLRPSQSRLAAVGGSRGGVGTQCSMPVRGEQDDAADAVLKLERMIQLRQQKKRWRAAASVGLNKLSRRSGATQHQDDSSSEESDHGSPFGEVRLAISSLPDFPVMAVRGAAHRAKGLVGRSGTITGRKGSPAGAVPQAQDASEGANVLSDTSDSAAMDGGAANFRFGRRRASQGVLSPSSASVKRGSMSSISSLQPPPPTLQSSSSAGPVLMRPEPLRPSSMEVPAIELSRSRSGGPTSSVNELHAVNEEDGKDHAQETPLVRATPLPDVSEQPLHEERYAEQASAEQVRGSTQEVRAGASAAEGSTDTRLRRPTLLVQSPTEAQLSFSALDSFAPSTEASQELIAITSSAHKPLDSATSSQGHTSIMGGALHDEPEVDSDGVVFEESSSSSDERDERQDVAAQAVGDGYESGGSTPSSEEDEDKVMSLQLEHGSQMSKKDAKRLLREHKRAARAARSASMNEGSLRGAALARGESISDRVRGGLKYATTESRNRRAMERFSPAVNRSGATSPVTGVGQGSMMNPTFSDLRRNATTSRSTTPLNGMQLASRRDSAVSSRRSSVSEDAAVQPFSPTLSENGDRWTLSDLGRHLPQRWNTSKGSLLGSQSGKNLGSVKSVRGHRLFSLRRRHRKADEKEDVDEEEPPSSPKAEDPALELERVLGKLIAQQAPEELKERYEYDVLHENQRGLLVFGIPKFSARTLLQWDPAAWTNAKNRDSPYSIVNAQLPDPSWEWVHPEWLIDMSGDVDEAGWQYANNFGKSWIPHFKRPRGALPRAGVVGAIGMNERLAREEQKDQERARQREDDGLEALKRSAQARSAKWRAEGDPGTFVRRRRWIRLRRRKALNETAPARTPREEPEQKSKVSSGDWSRLVAPPNKSADPFQRSEKVLASKRGTESHPQVLEDSDSLSNLEEDEQSESGDSSSSSETGVDGFMPRSTPKDTALETLEELQHTDPKEYKRRIRHQREFTGTIRDLKTLLPAIMHKERHGHSHSWSTTTMKQQQEKERKTSFWTQELDARNPFISWKLVKKRLNDADLAFASTSLRARERRHARHLLVSTSSARHDARVFGGAIPFAGERDVQGGAHSDQAHDAPAPTSPFDDLTRSALVEINFRRVVRVLRACKLDRQRLQLWQLWLGCNTSDRSRTRPTMDGPEEDIASSSNQKLSSGKKHTEFGLPDPVDVWDVLERHLDLVLLLFEFQGSRATLIRSLLSLHAESHPLHKFRRTSWTIGAPIDGVLAHPNAPPALDPDSNSRFEGVSAGRPAQHVGATEEWQAAEVPRLEFFSDLEAIARSYLEEPPQGVAAHQSQQQREAPHLHSPSPAGLPSRDSSPFGMSRSPPPALRFSPASRAHTPLQQLLSP
ncbi:FER-1-LIKE [Ceraceosorus bombacis]|uniref:FER-1-LIKE n=2 Tax=Ceraceosorus TaxID=401624 RepID=A0A0P1BFR5_9BASI|nr:FER-1-LIKE [Ceraceosorus bombacis]